MNKFKRGLVSGVVRKKVKNEIYGQYVDKCVKSVKYKFFVSKQSDKVINKIHKKLKKLGLTDFDVVNYKAKGWRGKYNKLIVTVNY